MWTFRTLTTPDEITAFKAGYEANLRRRSKGRLQCTVPYNYIAGSRAVGCYNKKGELVAGYITRLFGPFRCLNAIPEEAQAQSSFLAEHGREQMCELTCIWRGKGISHTAFALVVWPRIIADCVTKGRRFILGLGFDNTMNDIYRICRPADVYSGPSAAAETDTQVFIYAYTRPGIALTYVTNFWDRMIVLPIKRALRSAGSRPALTQEAREQR